ncbi:ClpP/crotonase [Exidia glandulosa HHB12029]|uniref:Probable enoyl-CoA hydratase, mitochondrial n=1 Tax=Exidia glandulosa HHB12029 TaxID=1314781 RepID=A0A165QGC1_EXIGL|nr:ClpP/crotonase [Exidia glandulosa HHB12029]
MSLLLRHHLAASHRAAAGLARARWLSTDTSRNVLISRPEPSVALLTLNRPKALNALNSALFGELNAALEEADEDGDIGAIVLTGSDKAFAAGADIKEMKDKQFADAYKSNFLVNWTRMSSIRKPIIGAVSGYALGGGCELALMCDILLASPTATFGQPEIKLGVIPGAGGTQRLTRIIGKARTMELVLTGRNFTADEAERWGVVSRIVREGSVVDEAVKVASRIAGFGRVSVQAGKEAVNVAFETTLEQGLKYERRLFHSLFATADQKEGMAAFTEKRNAQFKGE